MKCAISILDREVVRSLQEMRKIHDRSVPYDEIKELCTLALDVCQIIIERQVEDRKSLPEWQELERKTVEKMEQILVDPRCKHLYRKFPGGN